MLDKLNMKLINLNNSKVRGEYKVAVFDRYLVPLMKYHLTVDSLNKTHLEQLDQTARKYMKEWLGIPSRHTMYKLFPKFNFDVPFGLVGSCTMRIMFCQISA